MANLRQIWKVELRENICRNFEELAKKSNNLEKLLEIPQDGRESGVLTRVSLEEPAETK